MRDLRVALLELKDESDSGALTPLQPQKRAATKRWGLVAAAAAAVVLLIGGVALWRTNRPAVEPDQEIIVVPLTAHPGDERDPTFAPDGNQVAFAWGPEDGAPAIYVKLIGPGEPIRLTHTIDDERMPQWSPDGKWVAFPRSGPKRSQVVVIPALGGPEKILAQDRGSTYTSWSADSQWVAYCKENDSLYLSPLNGGETKFVLGPLQGKFPVFAGILSPDSRKVAVVYGIGQNQPLYVVSLSARHYRRLTPSRLTETLMHVGVQPRMILRIYRMRDSPGLVLLLTWELLTLVKFVITAAAFTSLLAVLLVQSAKPNLPRISRSGCLSSAYPLVSLAAFRPMTSSSLSAAAISALSGIAYAFTPMAA